MSSIKYNNGEWVNSNNTYSPRINIDYWTEEDKLEFYNYIDQKLQETFETTTLQISGNHNGSLYGVSVILYNVTLDSSLKMLWQETPILFDIQTGDSYYFVVDGTDIGYNVITTELFIAQANNNRSVEVIFELAELIINVGGIATNFTINVFSQTGKLLDQSFVSSKTIILPKNTTCSITASPIEDYITPNSQTVTVSSSTTVNFSYRYSKGVFILDLNNNYYTLNEFQSLSNKPFLKCIAIITDKHNFGVSITSETTLPVGVADNTLFTSLTKLEIVAALNDLNGSYNTAVLNTIWSDSATYAAPYCKVAVTDGMSIGGYLGSLGEWMIVYNNIDEINEILTAIGQVPIDTATSYFTSTPGLQKTSDSSTTGVWAFYCQTGTASVGTVALTSYKVRPFCSI